jgi:hypothetical protein
VIYLLDRSGRRRMEDFFYNFFWRLSTTLLRSILPTYLPLDIDLLTRRQPGSVFNLSAFCTYARFSSMTGLLSKNNISLPRSTRLWISHLDYMYSVPVRQLVRLPHWFSPACRGIQSRAHTHVRIPSMESSQAPPPHHPTPESCINRGVEI